MARFSAKRVLITGATSGIGLAGAKRIDSEGGWVIATGRDPRRLASLRRQLSDRARVIDNDASDPLTGAALVPRRLIHPAGLMASGSTPDTQRLGSCRRWMPRPLIA